jgi:hypothetical protein
VVGYTDGLDQHFSLCTRAVQLDQEDALPLAQLRLGVHDRDSFAAAQQELQAVRVPVRALVVVHVVLANAEVVVLVVHVLRQSRQPGGVIRHAGDGGALCRRIEQFRGTQRHAACARNV